MYSLDVDNFFVFRGAKIAFLAILAHPISYLFSFDILTKK